MEERHRLWQVLMGSSNDPALDILPLVMETQHRICPQLVELWENLTDEQLEQINLPDDFSFSFPCPFEPGEFLLYMGRCDDVLDCQPLRQLMWKLFSVYSFFAERSGTSVDQLSENHRKYFLECWKKFGIVGQVDEEEEPEN